MILQLPVRYWSKTNWWTTNFLLGIGQKQNHEPLIACRISTNAFTGQQPWNNFCKKVKYLKNANNQWTASLAYLNGAIPRQATLVRSEDWNHPRNWSRPSRYTSATWSPVNQQIHISDLVTCQSNTQSATLSIRIVLHLILFLTQVSLWGSMN